MADTPGEVASESVDPSEFVSARGVVGVAGVQVELEIAVPRGPVGPASVLPVLQALSTAVEARAIEEVEGQGRRVSCRAGCGACCRQLVPISRIEARHLAALVAGLPEPRRSAVRERFADAIRRLGEAGLLEILRRPSSRPLEEREALGMSYFREGVPCPFLEQESCSIHEDRPLICREYLVTSPAEHCADPKPETIEGVSMPVKLSLALRQFDHPGPGPASPWVPLVLSLEWSEANPETSPPRPGPEWIERLLGVLGGKPPPASP